MPLVLRRRRELRGFGEDETGEEAHWLQTGDDEPARGARIPGRRWARFLDGRR